MPNYLPRKASFFTTSLERGKMEALYQTYMDRLPADTEMLNVETSFGPTNVVHAGNPGAPALVLLHGRNACAPLLAAHFQFLLPDFRLFAVDLPGQPNLSAEVRLPAKTNAYGQWMHELLSKLGIWYANLVGVGLGAYAVLKSLQFDARRVAAAYLVSPLGLHSANRWQHYWQFQRPFRRFRNHPSPNNLNRLAKSVWEHPDEHLRTFWETILPRYRADTKYVPAFKRDSLRRVTTPVYCFTGSHTNYFSGNQEVSQQMPGLQAKIVLPNCGYQPSPQTYAAIGEYIKSSFGKHRG